jgi:hypothetical protein
MLARGMVLYGLLGTIQISQEACMGYSLQLLDFLVTIITLENKSMDASSTFDVHSLVKSCIITTFNLDCKDMKGHCHCVNYF